MNENDEESFQIYDLRIEVICPPGGHIFCGAKDGDYFTLEGEIMHLPPGQGFSIYSLGTCYFFVPFFVTCPRRYILQRHDANSTFNFSRHSPSFASKTATNTP